MAAGGGDRHGALGHLLAADVGEVVFVVRELLKQLVEREGVGSMSSSTREKRDRLRRGCRRR